MQDYTNQPINFRPPAITLQNPTLKMDGAGRGEERTISMNKRLLSQGSQNQNPQQQNDRRAVTQIHSRQTSRDNSPVLQQNSINYANNDYGAMRSSINKGQITANGFSMGINQKAILKPNLRDRPTLLSQSLQREINSSSVNHNNSAIIVPKTQQNSPRLLQTSMDQRQPQQDRKLNQSVDFVDRCQISIQDIIKSNMRKTTGDTVFGISGYHLPNTNIITQRPRTTKFTTYNVPHFIDKYTKSREFVPGPKYDTIPDWKNNFKARGLFSKSPRVTFTETVIKESKLTEYPGPGMYKHDDGFEKQKGGSVGKTNGAMRDKYCEFIEEASFMGTETPAPKYDPNYVRIDPDLKYARIKPSKFSRMDKIVKNPNKPAPGDYNSQDAYNKTQTNNYVFKIGSSKNRCFVDEYQRQKNFLPGIGAYKVEMKAYSILSKSPVSIRTLRH